MSHSFRPLALDRAYHFRSSPMNSDILAVHLHVAKVPITAVAVTEPLPRNQSLLPTIYGPIARYRACPKGKTRPQQDW
jgi:hypothetical protein